ncbi:MAG: nitrilase-related carbon-nitrogen hydrolase [Candidatus Competibacteraceae bacterium]
MDTTPILNALKAGDFHRALVLFWLWFRHDNNSFGSAEEVTIDEPGGHCKAVRKAGIALDLNQPLRLQHLLQQHALAVLEALDNYLWIAYGPISRRTPASRIEIGGEGFMVHRRVVTQQPAHVSKSGHLRKWLKHHWIIPEHQHGYTIQRLSANSAISLPCNELRAEGQLKIYAKSFPDQVQPAWLDQQPPAWSAFELTDAKKRWQGVLSALEDAARQNAHIVIFPELTLPPDLQNQVSAWLDEHSNHPFVLVLPGTFHAQVENTVYNECALFDRHGNPVLHHRKLTRVNQDDRPEKITTGECVQLLDTPIGLIGMPICLDFCEEDHPFGEIWRDLGVEWLLVPAFGGVSSLSAHKRKADMVRRAHDTVSVIANQHPKGEDGAHGFVRHEKIEELSSEKRWVVVRIK